MTIADSSLALLIDGDNVSPKIIAGLMAEIANYGTASVRRIYGDWTSPSLKGWKSCLLNHSITPIQQFAYTTGKNATDGAMIIDAMDLLYTGRFSSFCLVSSDSDFTRLASRIREQGVMVYGFGERKTSNAFVAACDKFMYFDVLNIEFGEPEKPPYAAEAPKPYGIPIVVPDWPKKDRSIQKHVLEYVWRSRAQVTATIGLIWLMLGISPDLNARNYGYERLREFLEASGMVEVKFKKMGDKPPIALVSLKEQ
ncbi:hypothetical protein GGP41_001221 [Bipolaris sorokiniana]|uniref:NYN domain-containing protein n=1 Tax=Cochliobolus sativus TaxID=45130 RepID=A0A8H5Z7P3_COCSA|nr:hypothetical protein GGP41_001221 [Bipolaris sorokiniana]